MSRVEYRSSHIKATCPGSGQGRFNAAQNDKTSNPGRVRLPLTLTGPQA
ncbi:MAG: hypothetical protein WBB25_23535 [Sulfitobacter sp.]